MGRMAKTAFPGRRTQQSASDRLRVKDGCRCQERRKTNPVLSREASNNNDDLGVSFLSCERDGERGGRPDLRWGMGSATYGVGASQGGLVRPVTIIQQLELVIGGSS